MVAATVFSLLVVEVGLRVQAALEDRGILKPDLIADLEAPAPPAEAELGHLIAISDNPRIIYELRPNLDVVYVGHRLHTNRHGLRGRELPPGKVEGTARIIGLGDSIMFGLGVGDDQTYLAIVERRLNGALPSRDWQVVNTAVPGYNTVMEVETLAVRGLAWEPDLVILDFVGNDLALPNFIRLPRPVLSLDHSFLAELVERRTGGWRDRSVFKLMTSLGIGPAPGYGVGEEALATDPDLVPAAYRDHVGWAGFRGAMLRLRRLADAHGFAVLVLSLSPDPGQLQERAFALAEELGFFTHDGGAALARYMAEHGMIDYRGSALTLSAVDPHPSALGHRVIAEDLVAVLLDQILPAAGLLPPKES
jgi:hypothetical protein